MSPTSAERGQIVREKLLAAAVELIGELGWNAVSTRNIAQRAGISPGLIHYHFSSLTALLRQAALGTFAEVMEESKTILRQAPTLEAAIDTMLSYLGEFSGTDPVSMLGLEMYIQATRDAEVQTQLWALTVQIREELSNVLKQNGHDDPDGAALAIVAIMDGFMLHKALDPTIEATSIFVSVKKIIAVKKLTLQKGNEYHATEPTEPTEPTE